MNIILILVASIVGTSVMTAFSYFMSRIFSNQFREPQLLNEIFNGWKSFPIQVGKKSPFGWFIHYLVGFIFTIGFAYVWNNVEMARPDYLTGAVFGFFAGVIGIFTWQLMLNIVKKPPKIVLHEHFIQLLIAHIIFGLGVIAVYQMDSTQNLFFIDYL